MKDIIYKVAVSGTVKLASAIAAFVSTVMITRMLGASEAGYVLLAISLLATLSVFFRLGLDNVILRVIGANDLSAVAQMQLRTGLLWILSASIPFALLISLGADWISVAIFNKADFASTLRWAIWALPCMSFFMLLAMGFVGLQQVVRGTFFQNLGLTCAFLLLMGACYWWAPHLLSAELAAKLYMVSALFIVCLSVVLWCSKPSAVLFLRARFIDPALWMSSSNLWIASTMSLAVVWSGVLVAGAFLPAAELAYLSAAQRTANLTSFVLMVVNMVVAPRYAKLWAQGNPDGVRKLARWSTRGMILLALPVIALMLFMPERIMSVFGGGFEQGAVLLMIMSVGQFINVATGSVGYLLQMSGHERDFRRVTMFSGPLAIVCAVWFTWQWGAIGAASATAVGLSVQNLGALWMVKKRLGFWPVG
jgi:O-antigen/teichoic acid export membrane protein